MISRLAMILVLMIASWLLFTPGTAYADDPIPGNLVSNFSFEEGFLPYSPYPNEPGEVANGWTPFIINGRPTFRDTAAMSPGFVEKIDGLDSQAIWSWGNPFVAGIYQHVPGLVPGATYTAWYATSGAYINGGPPGLERTIGVDPYGGTDATAPQVIWGTKYDNGPWATIEKGDAPKVVFVAPNSAVTLFVKVISTAAYPQAYQAFVDAVALVRTAPVNEMQLATDHVSFLATLDGKCYPETLAIAVDGTGSFTWTATVSSTGWLKPVQTSGARGDAVRLSVANLPSETGQYRGEVQVVASQGTLNPVQTATVDLVVTSRIYQRYLPLLSARWSGGW